MLKRLLYLISFVVVSYGTAIGTLHILELYFNFTNGNTYFDSIGDESEENKVKPLVLLKRSFSRSDNLPVFGSCELLHNDMNAIFINKNNGFQINKIGSHGHQSIIHAMNLGAFNQDITDKKIFFLSSSSWFRKSGITKYWFEASFSKIKFYSFMFNKKLSNSLKKRLARRIIAIPKKKSYGLEIFYAKIYSNERNILNILPKIVHPLYFFCYKLLIVRDKHAAYQKLNEYRRKNIPEITKTVIKNHDWENEKLLALEKDKKVSHNDFHIEDDWYDKAIKDYHLPKYKFDIPADSLEREDFLIFLEVCQEQKVKPIIVNLPLHGKIADHFDLKFMFGMKNQRIEFNKWFRETVSSYNFELVDLSEYEYVDYFNNRFTTMGSYGRVHVYEAISQFYNKN